MGLSSSSSNSFIFFLRKSMLAICNNDLQVKCYLKRARLKQRRGEENENVEVHAGRLFKQIVAAVSGTTHPQRAPNNPSVACRATAATRELA